MTEQERKKIDEVYQKIINLLAQEGLTEDGLKSAGKNI